MPTPFPRSMQHDEEFDWWRGSIKLPQFRDVKIKVPGRKSTSSTIELRVEADDDGPMEAQGAAYTYLLDNQTKVLDACVKGIAKTAKLMRPILEKTGWFDAKQLDELIPKSPTVDALRTRVQLYDVCVTNRVKSGVAHVEYSCNCAWDREHGLLIVLHRDRLVYSGLTGDGW
jgi:hypothetical protein